MRKDVDVLVDNFFTGLPESNEAMKMASAIKNQLHDKYDYLIKEGKNDDEALGIICREFGRMDEIKYELMINETIEISDQYSYISNVSKQRFNAATGIFAAVIGLIFYFYYMSTNYKVAMLSLLAFVAVGIYFIIISTTHAKKIETNNTPNKHKKKGAFTFSSLTALTPFIYIYFGFYDGSWAYGWIIIPVSAIVFSILDKLFGLN